MNDQILLRIEKKLDEILSILSKHVNSTLTTGALPIAPQPMQADHQVCPLCRSPIEYIVKYYETTAGKRQICYRQCRCTVPTTIIEMTR